jgi:hypothetical protein
MQVEQSESSSTSSEQAEEKHGSPVLKSKGRGECPLPGRVGSHPSYPHHPSISLQNDDLFSEDAFRREVVLNRKIMDFMLQQRYELELPCYGECYAC